MMKEVSVSIPIDGSNEQVKEQLSPNKIIEYVGTYAIESCERVGDSWILTARTKDIVVLLEFTELENGYMYEQRGDQGPFAQMKTKLTIHDRDCADGVLVTARSRYTFGSIFAFLIDRLAIKHRKTELHQLLISLKDETESSVSADSRSDSFAHEKSSSESTLSSDRDLDR